MQQRSPVQGQITFLYYRQIEPAAVFYGEVMGLELIEDQGGPKSTEWAATPTWAS